MPGSPSGGRLRVVQVGELDQVAAGVVEHRGGDRAHHGRLLHEAHAHGGATLALSLMSSTLKQLNWVLSSISAPVNG